MITGTTDPNALTTLDPAAPNVVGTVFQPINESLVEGLRLTLPLATAY